MRLAIIGASGHGRVVADVAALNGYDEIVFLDDDETLTECGGYPVVGTSDDAPDGPVFVAIGNAEIRKRLTERYAARELPTLVHPRAIVSRDCSIGRGTVIMAGAVVNPGAAIGQSCIVNTCASVDHDCIIGDFVHVSVGARVCGTVKIGERTWVGAGAVLKNNICVCGGCMIGAGAVVIRDIHEAGTYVGVPAERKGGQPKGDAFRRCAES